MTGNNRRATRLLLAAVAGWMAGVPALAAPGSQNPAALCDAVAQRAADLVGLPASVLQAITRTETGRKRGGKLSPWPWTVNMEGVGHWFETRDIAEAYAAKEFARGARSFDVGCFQINYKWHHKAFSSLEEMFDPMANALYAARFLKALHAETGSWSGAAGAYHSRTPEFAHRYRARFDRIHSNLPEPGDIPTIPDIVLAANAPQAGQSVPRENRYPLLRGGGAASLGSLFPRSNGGGARLIALPAEVR